MFYYSQLSNVRVYIVNLSHVQLHIVAIVEISNTSTPWWAYDTCINVSNMSKMWLKDQFKPTREHVKSNIAGDGTDETLQISL